MVRRRLLALLPALVLAVFGCGPGQLEVTPDHVSRSGGTTLDLRGEFAGHGGVVVLVDGVAAHDAVLVAAARLQVELPALPRSGTVDIELVFADGTHLRLPDALSVSEPRLDVRP